MGSHVRAFTAARHNLATRMSWTWRGFWRDDPVFRFKNESFFQSGRHKAEERFWVNYIHNDGSYTRPVRARHSSAPSASEEHEKDSNSDQDKESLTEPIIDEETHAGTLGTEESDDPVDETKNQNINENKIGGGVIKRESKENEEKASTLTCLSCSKCSQPLGWVEKERYMSRML